MPNPVRGILAAGAAVVVSLTTPIFAQTGSGLLEGTAAFGDWRTDHPGARRLIRPQDLPAPDMAQSASNVVRTVRRTDDQKPIVPNGFEVNLFASGLLSPRVLRTAPNGDIFVAESAAGRIRVLRPNGSGAPESKTFATGLRYPFGIAFYPPGPNPQWVYSADTNSVVRFAYQNGDQTARGPAETVVPRLPTGGHTTRDIAFSPDGKTMYVSVGSGSNDAEGMERMSPAQAQKWQASHPPGASWGSEENRADVLAFDPDGRNMRVFATGIRNCVGLAVDSSSGTVWCSTNERDGLGDNLPPDYITRVREGAFYGWPWYYIGAHDDPHHRGARPDLKNKVTVPDVLLQAHSASLGLAIYNATQFQPSIAAACSPPNMVHGIVRSGPATRSFA